MTVAKTLLDNSIIVREDRFYGPAQYSDYKNTLFSVDLSSLDCQKCPKKIRISAASAKHANQHHAYNYKLHGGNATKNAQVAIDTGIARSARTTSFVEGYSLDQTLQRILDKKPRLTSTKGESEGRGSLAFEFLIFLEEKSTKQTKFRIVICNQPTCNDSNGVGRFSKGDLITIYPLCGPNVVVIPAKEWLSDFVRDGIGQSPYKKKCL